LLSTSQPPPALPQVIQLPNQAIQPTTKPDPGFPLGIAEEADNEQVDLVEDDDAGYKHEKLFVVGYNRSNLDKRHVIILFYELINFLDTNFVSRKCCTSKSTYQQQTRGIATSINWFCGCHAGGSIKGRIRNNDKERTKKWKNTIWTWLLPTAAMN
jgi:hypothetical protein